MTNNLTEAKLVPEKKKVIAKIHHKLQFWQSDWLLINNSNNFFLEYLPPEQQIIRAITGFDGSNAILLISKKEVIFFTDGRYLLQAQQQINCENLTIIDLATTTLTTKISQTLKQNQVLAIDGDSFAIDKYQQITNIANQLKFQILPIKRREIVDLFALELQKQKLEDQKPEDFHLSKKKSPFFLNQSQSGRSGILKCQDLQERVKKQFLQNSNDDNFAIFINHPEDVAWLLNLRGFDLKETPIIFASALLFQNKIFLFLEDQAKIEIVENLLVEQKLQNNNYQQNLGKTLEVFLYQYQKIAEIIEKNIKELKISKIIIEENNISANLYQIFSKLSTLLPSINLVSYLRSIKNIQEINGAIISHKIDAVAVIKFIFWLKQGLKNHLYIDEITASLQLAKFREENEAFFSESFSTISAFAGNGAIIHYRSNEATNKQIIGDSLYLVDSGGQYCGKDFIGTTDITRTIAIGKINQNIVENYTRVLKGHIALASAKFPKENVANQFDILARYHLWNANLDYAHGTGHGVGSFLGVHEGPFAINKRNNQQLVEGVIISNEPGFYYSGENWQDGYGIRLENLMLATTSNNDNWLEFTTLTLVPFEHSLINFQMLTYKERLWLKKYYQQIDKEISPLLPEDVANWLKQQVTEIENLNHKS